MLAKRARTSGRRPEELLRGRQAGRFSRRSEAGSRGSEGEDACRRMVEAACGRNEGGRLEKGPQGLGTKRGRDALGNQPPSSKRVKGSAVGKEEEDTGVRGREGSGAVGAPVVGPQGVGLDIQGGHEEEGRPTGGQARAGSSTQGGPWEGTRKGGRQSGGEEVHLADEGAVATGHEEGGVEGESLPHGGGGQMAYGKGHRVARTGTVSWCVRCGAHAESRVGAAMAGECSPIQEGEKSGRAYRRSLLLRGQHPIARHKLV